MKDDIRLLKLKTLVASPDYTKAEKLSEIARREAARVPENYALEVALARAERDVQA